MHVWNIQPAGQANLLEIAAARIVISHNGALIFLDATGLPVYAMAPSAWVSVERVPEETTVNENVA